MCGILSQTLLWCALFETSEAKITLEEVQEPRNCFRGIQKDTYLYNSDSSENVLNNYCTGYFIVD